MHRFDDPQREYRTLYVAEQRITCLRETLADLRPNARAIAEYTRLFGQADDLLVPVPRDWLEQHALARGRLEMDSGELVDIDDSSLRSRFEREYADLLDAHGMEHLDISEVRSGQRIVTQTLSRWLFDRGASGMRYGSSLDNLPCLALFEDRADLAEDGEPEPLTDLPSELLEVCRDFGLVLHRESTT